jgi:hypothetical protein
VEAETVLILALCILMRRKAIVPAKLVPIIDVLAQRNDLCICDRLVLLEFCEQSIGGRTTRAALRGEKFNQNRRAMRGLSYDFSGFQNEHE